VELFANHDRLASDVPRNDDGLEAAPASDVRIDQQLHLEGGEWKPSSMPLSGPAPFPAF